MTADFAIACAEGCTCGPTTKSNVRMDADVGCCTACQRMDAIRYGTDEMPHQHRHDHDDLLDPDREYRAQQARRNGAPTTAPREREDAHAQPATDPDREYREMIKRREQMFGR